MNIAIIYSSQSVPEFLVTEPLHFLDSIDLGTKIFSKCLRDEGCSLSHRLLLEQIAKAIGFSDLHHQQQEILRLKTLAQTAHFDECNGGSLQRLLERAFAGALSFTKPMIAICHNEFVVSDEIFQRAVTVAERFHQSTKFDLKIIQKALGQLIGNASWVELEALALKNNGKRDSFELLPYTGIDGRNWFDAAEIDKGRWAVWGGLIEHCFDPLDDADDEGGLVFWTEHAKQAVERAPYCLFARIAAAQLTYIYPRGIREAQRYQNHLVELFEALFGLKDSGFSISTKCPFVRLYLEAVVRNAGGLLCMGNDLNAQSVLESARRRIKPGVHNHNEILVLIADFFLGQIPSTAVRSKAEMQSQIKETLSLVEMVLCLQMQKIGKAKEHLLRAFAADPRLIGHFLEPDDRKMYELPYFKRQVVCDSPLSLIFLNIAEYRFGMDVRSIANHDATFQMLVTIQREFNSRSRSLEESIEAQVSDFITRLPVRWRKRHHREIALS